MMSQCSVVPSCYASVDDRCVIFGSGAPPSFTFSSLARHVVGVATRGGRVDRKGLGH
jgi:hypothetical protein